MSSTMMPPPPPPGQFRNRVSGSLAESDSGSAATNSIAAAVRKLFSHECPARACPPRWSEFSTVQGEMASLEGRIHRYPIVHRLEYSRAKGWVTASFTVHSRFMKNILEDALEDYQDLDMDLENWTFRPPFMPIVHRWETLLGLQRTLQTGTEKEEKREQKIKAAADLVAFLAPLLGSSIDSLSETRTSGKIAFDNLWQIYPPAELVVTDFFGVTTICRVTDYKRVTVGKVDSWVVTMEYVDWNGDSCGFAETRRRIPEYDGFVHVTSLPVYPVPFLQDPETFKNKVRWRGRWFEKLRGYHFRSYQGTKILINEKAEERPVSGRIVIDAHAFYRSSNMVKPALRSLDDNEKEDSDETSPEPTPKPRRNNSWHSRRSSMSSSGAESVHVEVAHHVHVEVADLMALTAAKPGASERTEDLRPLTDEQCLLANPWVLGMDLKSKQWGRFFIDNISDIVWNDDAFDNLVLPGGEKELAWDFVESKARYSEQYDDFVAEKGRGIIILMFGPPGVGKTYTAEAVSERARVPLYSISAGTLGTKPKEVETELEHALELCRMWNAMLLLDEADVFLGARTDDGLTRNELVSIFLTKLEYYQGILFLTTNRIASIDHAFQSRVDLFLPYRNLGTAARRQVWANFVNHLGRGRFDMAEADLDALAELKLNGREIKNLIKTAQLLSFKSGGKVTAQRLRVLAEKRIEALSVLDS